MSEITNVKKINLFLNEKFHFFLNQVAVCLTLEEVEEA